MISHNHRQLTVQQTPTHVTPYEPSTADIHSKCVPSTTPNDARLYL
jgi:hypothetical protein